MTHAPRIPKEQRSFADRGGRGFYLIRVQPLISTLIL